MTAPLARVRADRTDYPLRGRLMTALLLSAVLVVGLGGWGATAQLNSAVIGSGVVKVDRELKTVQHSDGGTLSAILLAPGDPVAAGQVILRLDTRETKAAIALLRVQLVDLTVRSARLVAERDGLDQPVAPPGFLAAYPAAAQELAGEARLLANARAERQTERQVLVLKAEQLAQDTAALEARRVALERQLDVASRTVTRSGSLAGSGILSKAQVEAAESEQARVSGALQETEAQILSNVVQAREIAVRSERLDRTAAYEAHRKLREIEPVLAETRQKIEALELRLARAEVKAPVAGLIHELPVNTIGQVVGPGEVLATIVPEGADLVIEFRVPTTDIDQLAAGQEARLRFPAFNRRTTPELVGRIATVAPASTTDPATGTSFFLATAAPAEGVSLPEGAVLVPGMPVEVYVTTRSRTAYDYIAQPIRDSLTRSMIEE
ncbi:HlyD family secretion protein [Cereibacter changlensis]|uniref:Membrane fusion protein (MFP) family protein n=2 Tax=Cereibacter changlensis TaxID=402884 RepID=A0A2W7RBA1_9RHOB|nr:HlyD family type I secretion periplasmic adaptor subunit [Cereibacter changlensis]PZX56436.1 HlyD family secretion protein [Cereibacter changlensis]